MKHCCRIETQRVLFPDIFIVGDQRSEGKPEWKVKEINWRPPPSGWRPSDTWLLENFLKPPAGYEDKPKTTLITVYRCITMSKNIDIGFINELLWTNRGQTEMAACNILLFACVHHEKAKKVFPSQRTC
jgi:hypothetical protein